MGDTSIIARRISDGKIEYGWSGNGGYFSNVGSVLLKHYDSPLMTRYLFSLGQLKRLLSPLSEWRDDTWYKTTPDGRPHYICASEEEIFYKIMFVDYAYFYDSDNVWYYIQPGPFNIKLPLELVGHNLDDEDKEYPFMREVERAVLSEMAGAYYKKDEAFRKYLLELGYDAEGFRVLASQLLEQAADEDEYVLSLLHENAENICRYFDRWVVVRASEDNKHIGDILLRPKDDYRLETYLW